MSYVYLQSFDRENCCSVAKNEVSTSIRASSNSRIGFYPYFPSCPGNVVCPSVVLASNAKKKLVRKRYWLVGNVKQLPRIFRAVLTHILRHASTVLW